MKFLLDTDHLSILQRESGGEFTRLSARVNQAAPDHFALCIVSFHEQALGCNSYIARAKKSAEVVRGYRMFDRILSAFSSAVVLTFDNDAALVFEKLTAMRLRVGRMDLRIASIAMSRGLILLTRNSVDFGRVPGLIIEDWTI